MPTAVMAQNVYTTQNVSVTMSRHELLAWINNTVGGNYGKVEDLASGAAYCQMLEIMFPGTVPMKRVKMDAKSEIDFINNFKLFQTGLMKQKVDKDVAIERLVKKKFQDNLEFLQWFRKFWEVNYGTEGECTPQKAPFGSSSNSSVNRSRQGASRGNARSGPGVRKTGSGASSRSNNGMAEAQLAEMTNQMSEMQITVEGLEKERDFYFGKLRKIEILAQSPELEGNHIVQEILQILYETEDGFEIPETEEGAEGAAAVAE
eukprot:Clim_evm19s243 gene=Clim_evmTU19s243